MKIYNRDLHNDTIKTSDNGGLESIVDYMTQKVLIIDTTLRSFIRPKVCKMTIKLRHICGCELCIITKARKIDLNIFIKKPVIYIYNRNLFWKTHATVYLILQVMCITNIKCFHMANVYTLLYKMLLSASPVFLLNQIILLISSLILVFVMNVLSKKLPMKN